MYAEPNKFEKQVQEKLQELHLSPSASVWDNVEAQLPSRSRRHRLIVFYASLIIAGLGITGYLFVYPKMSVNKEITSTQSVQSATTPYTNKTLLSQGEPGRPVTTPVTVSGAITSPASVNTPSAKKSNSTADGRISVTYPILNSLYSTGILVNAGDKANWSGLPSFGPHA